MSITLDKALFSSILISASVLIAGCVFFISSWAYSEQWHEILFSVYAACSAGLFFTLRSKYKQLTIFLALILIFTVAYANLKFEWRKEYIMASKSNVRFELDPYIERYPLFEEHILPSLFGVPQWINFNDDCLRPILKQKPANRSCRSVKLIENRYGFNVEELINMHYKKMQNTAQNLERGKIKNKKQLITCLHSKKCARIPLLPAGVQVEEINEESEDYIDVRRQFWSLINENEISPANCEFMDLCRAMRDIGVIGIKKPN